MMFSAMLIRGIRLRSWCTALIPASMAARALVKLVGSPKRRTVPWSGRWMPVRILISVDLPAPFSPSSAWISPGRRTKSTSSRALTPGKLLDAPVTSSTGPLGAATVCSASRKAVVMLLSAGDRGSG